MQSRVAFSATKPLMGACMVASRDCIEHSGTSRTPQAPEAQQCQCFARQRPSHTAGRDQEAAEERVEVQGHRFFNNLDILLRAVM
jgi:hypothetical protein